MSNRVRANSSISCERMMIPIGWMSSIKNELKKKVQIEQQNMNSMLHCYLIYHNLANQIFQRKI